MFKKISTLMEYVIWLYKQHAALQKANDSVFRIVKTEKSDQGEHIIHAQVKNKASVFQCTAREIVAEDQLLECFSKSDIRHITYLATEDLLKPKNKIIGFEYDTELHHTILQIKTIESEQIRKLTVDQISNNPDLLKNLSQMDAHRTGYLTAVEQMMLEQEAILKCNINT